VERDGKFSEFDTTRGRGRTNLNLIIITYANLKLFTLVIKFSRWFQFD
jgi:hypothetical protein